MGVVEKLATSLKRRDEVPNQQLAKEIISKDDRKAVAELVKNLANKNSGIQGDCIKVLYEIGEAKPELISPYAKDFISLLGNKNNRLSWGAMTALDTIALENSELIYEALPELIGIGNEGSVITRDHLVNILIKLASIPKYQKTSLKHLVEQLKTAPDNQLPMYAERALPIINDSSKAPFVKILSSRLDAIPSPSKRKRVEKVLKLLS